MLMFYNAKMQNNKCYQEGPNESISEYGMQRTKLVHFLHDLLHKSIFVHIIHTIRF